MKEYKIENWSDEIDDHDKFINELIFVNNLAHESGGITLDDFIGNLRYHQEMSKLDFCSCGCILGDGSSKCEDCMVEL